MPAIAAELAYQVAGDRRRARVPGRRRSQPSSRTRSPANAAAAAAHTAAGIELAHQSPLNAVSASQRQKRRCAQPNARRWCAPWAAALRYV
ncbi:MAG: hypothetical protein ABIY55_01635, partial [Kofleriaceae bacterium]